VVEGVAGGDLTPPSTVADVELLQEVRQVISTRASYGYRRTAAIIRRQRRREGRPPVNHKRVYRLMREHGLLLQRHVPTSARSRPRRQDHHVEAEPALVFGLLRGPHLER
jgi:hypothetical protein